MAVIVPTAGGPSHRLIRVTVRPPRFAVFVHAEERWHSKVTRVVECLSRTWGGVGAILIPLVGEHIDEVPEIFWSLIEGYDADWLSSYRTSYRGMQLASPEEFDKYANQEAAKFAAITGMTVDQARRSIFTEHEMHQPLGGELALSSSVVERVRRNLSSFMHLESRVDEHIFTADDETHRPLADMTRVRRLEGNGTMNILDTSLLGERTQLLLAMRLGKVAPGYQAALDAHETSQMRDRADPEDLPVLIELAHRGRVEAHSWSMHRAMRGATGIPDPTWKDTIYSNDSPFGWTAAGCSWYSMWARSRAEEAPFIVVAGDTFVDFCVAHALDRMTGRAIWLPIGPAESGDEAKAMRESVADWLMDARRTDASARFASTSLDASSLEKLFAEVRAEKRGYTARSDLAKVDVGALRDTDVRVTLPRRLLDRTAQGDIRFEPFVGNEMAGMLKTPTPSLGLSDDPPDVVEWMVDASIDEVRLPTRRRVAPLLTRDSAFSERVRASSDGPSYVSHSWGFVPAGLRLDQRLARPRLRLPSPIDVFNALLAANGMRAEISQAGAFTNAATELFGGFPALVRAFAAPTSRALLEAFRPPRKRRTSADEDPGAGVYLDLLQRRFLSIADVLSASAGADAADVRALLDTYVERGILYRGIVLKCRRCRFNGWYRAGEFSQSFTCTRCRATWPLSRAAWRDPPDEPTWRYELDDVVCQTVIENARAPVLALQALRADARLGFAFSPELNVYEGDAENPFAELDIWAIVEGRICVGEAKTVDHLAKQGEADVVRRLVRVAEAVTADELVIATTQESLRPTTRDLLEGALAGRRPRLRILEGPALEAAARRVSD